MIYLANKTEKIEKTERKNDTHGLNTGFCRQSVLAELPHGLTVGLFLQALDRPVWIKSPEYGLIGHLKYARLLLEQIHSPYFKALCSAKLASALYFNEESKAATEHLEAAFLGWNHLPHGLIDDALQARNLLDEILAMAIRVHEDALGQQIQEATARWHGEPVKRLNAAEGKGSDVA